MENDPASIVSRPPGEKNSIKILYDHVPTGLQGYYIFKVLIDIVFVFFKKNYNTTNIMELTGDVINKVHPYTLMFGYIFRLQIFSDPDDYSHQFYSAMTLNAPYCVLYNDETIDANEINVNSPKKDECNYAFITKINDVVYKMYFISM
jgi:hypothetical protein